MFQEFLVKGVRTWFFQEISAKEMPVFSPLICLEGAEHCIAMNHVCQKVFKQSTNY